MLWDEPKIFFLERRYFFSIILSEFLKNRVALQFRRFFVVEKDVEMFLEACELKGLSMKTIGSYEQTMRLFIRFSNEQGIVQTEKVTHMMVQNYISVN